MSKTVKYNCDLCKENKERKYLFGMYFKYDVIPQKYVLLRDKIDECDKHICEDCIKLIKESF